MNLRIKIAITLTLVVTGIAPMAAQPALENSIFWEVSGNGLQHPSYLFGTFHFVGKSHIDTLNNVLAKFSQSGTVVGELVLDSSAVQKTMAASFLRGTTLDKVLTPELYQRTAVWLKELSGYDLSMFNAYNPVTAQIFIMMMMQQKHSKMFDSITDPAMDVYFQQSARTQGKKVLGLETVDVQIQLIYNQFSYARQAELLAAYVDNKDKFDNQLSEMNRYYFEGNLNALEGFMQDEFYTEAELKRMLDDRNDNWMRQLPTLFQHQRTFVAVGAMHLAGKKGLVTQLRQMGYQVKPLLLR